MSGEKKIRIVDDVASNRVLLKDHVEMMGLTPCGEKG